MKSLLFFMIAFPILAFAQRKKEQQTPTYRDPLKWPFPQTSIWNMLIHKDARYVPAKIFIPKNGISADEDYLVLTPTAPNTKIYTNRAGWDRTKDRCVVEGGLLFSAPIPTDFVINRDN